MKKNILHSISIASGLYMIFFASQLTGHTTLYVGIAAVTGYLSVLKLMKD